MGKFSNLKGQITSGILILNTVGSEGGVKLPNIKNQNIIQKIVELSTEEGDMYWISWISVTAAVAH